MVNDLNTELIDIKKRLSQVHENYRNVMTYLAGDAPIQVLCLPKATENILLNNGFHRIYDLFDRNLVEIKGLGNKRLRDLTSRLDQFISVC